MESFYQRGARSGLTAVTKRTPAQQSLHMPHADGVPTMLKVFVVHAIVISPFAEPFQRECQSRNETQLPRDLHVILISP